MEEKKSNGLAIASLVLGIVAIVFNFIGLGIVGLILGIVGIVLGVLAKKKNPSGMATAGLVLSIIGTVSSMCININRLCSMPRICWMCKYITLLINFKLIKMKISIGKPFNRLPISFFVSILYNI